METGKANNIQSSSFNIDLCKQYQLLIQLGLKHFSYCIININTNNVEYFKNLPINDEIINIINKEEILKSNFASTSVSFANFPCTLVPNEVFEIDTSKEMLEFNTEVYDIIKSDKLSNIDAHLIYTIPSEINELVHTFFTNAQQKAQQTILIDQFKQFDNEKEHAYLYINQNILTITAFKKNKLIFNNSFDFDTKEDLLYYSLFSFEQLKLNTETVKVKLYGQIIKEDANYQLLYEYIRNIAFGSRPKQLKFSSEFNNLPDHQFYTLFSQSI
ncbi:MAG: DUF3822 family protein [Bacteroidota bacterium]|nr:DUF3822 family protein [Bacteroidota bacterium]